MGRKLNALQRTFVVRHITGKSPNDLAKQDFDRRKSKVTDELAKLDPKHPARGGLERRLADAERMATGPNANFDAAYDHLETVKSDARDAAKNYQRAISPTGLTVTLSSAEKLVARIAAMVKLSHDTMADLIQTLQNEPLPENADYAAILASRQDLTRKEAMWRSEVVTSKSHTDDAGKLATGLGLSALLASVRTDLGVLAQSKDKKAQADAGKLTERAGALADAGRLGGAMFDNGVIQSAFAVQVEMFEAELRRLKPFQNPAVDPATKERFGHLDERENGIMQSALKSYSTARAKDAVVLNPTFNVPSRPKPAALPKFRTGDVLPPMLDLTATFDGPTIQKLAQEVGLATKGLLGNEAKRSSNSDVLFDATTTSLDKLEAGIAKSLRLEGQSSGWPQDKADLVKALAQAMRDAAIAVNPNKASDEMVLIEQPKANTAENPQPDASAEPEAEPINVPKAFNLNGVTYGNPKFLGKGGLGVVTSYEGPVVDGTSETIVVKSATALGAKARNELGLEMEAHRRMMGGEAHTPPKNVVEMKGAAVSPDGTLHMIMAKELGDTERFANAIAVMARSGVLPKAAQLAMQQETMIQAAEGLKAMQDNGLLHNDIKPGNFLVGRDGSVKIADLGSSEDAVDQRADTPPTTMQYSSQEFGRDEIRSDKSDVHALGVMLGVMNFEGGPARLFKLTRTPATVLNTKHGSTSLDRLINAMVAPKPEDRPTLDGVLLSSYLNEARTNFGDGKAGASDLAQLRSAIADYVDIAGDRVQKLNEEIDEAIGTLEFSASNEGVVPSKRHLDLVAKHSGNVAALQSRIDEINLEPGVKTALEAVRTASAPFGTSTDDRVVVPKSKKPKAPAEQPVG